MKLGTERAKQTISQLERTRALPQQDIRETLACAQMQILHPEGACVPVKICDKVRTAMVRAIWGPTLEPNNTMRSVAATLGLFVPLHVAAPHINCFYQAVICMAHVQVQLPAIARSLWEFRHKRWQGHVGFAKLFMRQIQTQGWNWISPDRIQTSGSCEVVLSSLLLDGPDGERAKHQFRDILRQIWWAEWAPLRHCLQGTAFGVDRLLSLRPVHNMRKGNFSTLEMMVRMVPDIGGYSPMPCGVVHA